MFCDKCGTYLSEGTQYCTNCGAPQGEAAQAAAPSQSVGPAADMPMKWYKFLIYFALFLSAVSYFYNAFNEIRYLFDFFSVFSVLLLIVNILLGVMALRVRGALAKFKANAPKQLLQFYILGLVPVILQLFMPIIYGYAHATVLGTVIGNIVGTFVAVWLNKIYFDKRKHLFAN